MTAKTMFKLPKKWGQEGREVKGEGGRGREGSQGSREGRGGREREGGESRG